MDIKQEIADMKGIPVQDELNKLLREDIYTVTFLKFLVRFRLIL